MTRAYLGLGSNLGNRDANLAEARRRLTIAGAEITRASRVLETEPFGVEDQPLFLNQIVEVEWASDARTLLAAVQAVEAGVGRTPTYRWGPREIDVDILLFGDEVIDEPDLQVPHPGLWARDFVVRPLRELRPDLLPG